MMEFENILQVTNNKICHLYLYVLGLGSDLAGNIIPRQEYK